MGVLAGLGTAAGSGMDPSASVSAQSQGASDDKRRFQFDSANTGATTATSAPSSSATELWDASVNGSVSASPAVADGRVYVASTDGVTALNTADGSTDWTFTWNGSPISFGRYFGNIKIKRARSSPTVRNGTVYVGNDDGRIYALDASDGGFQWSHDTGEIVSGSPAVVGGTVYAGHYGGAVVALDGTTGDVQWSASTDNPVASSPAVDSGTVYVGDGVNQGGNSGVLYALDAGNGSEQWSYPPEQNDGGGGGPPLPGPMPPSPFRFAVDQDLGSLALMRDFGRYDAPIPGAPTVADGAVFFCGSTALSSVYAVDTDGSVRWQKKVGAQHFGSPAVYDDTVYVWANVNGHRLIAYDAATGIEQWRYDPSATTELFMQGYPVYVDGVLYVTASTSRGDPVFAALDPTDGSELWRYRKGDSVGGAPAPVNNRIYGADENGRVFALKSRQDVDVKLIARPPNVFAGDRLRLDLELTNVSGRTLSPALAIDGLVGGFSVGGHTDDGGSFSTTGNGVEWNWSSVGPNQSVNPALELDTSRGLTPQDYTLTVEGSPDGRSFSRSLDRTVTVVGSQFDLAKQNKLALADRVDDVSLSVNDASRARSALTHLTNNVSSGAVAQSRATRAVRRMKLAENVTETALVATGPADTVPRRQSTLVGSRKSVPENDLIGTIIDFTVSAAVWAASMGRALAKMAKFLPNGSTIGRAINNIGDSFVTRLLAKGTSAIRNFLTFSSKSTSALSQTFNGTALGGLLNDISNLLSGTKPAQSPYKTIAGATFNATAGGSARDGLVEQGRRAFEGAGSPPGGVTLAVQDGLDDLSGRSGSGPSPQFSGSQSAAESEMQQAIADINAEVDSAQQAFDRKQLQSTYADVFDIITSVIDKIVDFTRNAFRRVAGRGFGPVGSAVSTGIGLASLAADFTSTFLEFREKLATLTDGFITLVRVQNRHFEAYADIINP